ncbi:hypothetical protein QYF61_017866 [Mycteria americana]|uniref:Uncharacterized protein n=1 Tax=Mycteria americana TaxID=33587 RepID=A0AAN7NGU7_MYCAM|nr:hypothetical protein QYF61_017866 [Mycteria americana]
MSFHVPKDSSCPAISLCNTREQLKGESHILISQDMCVGGICTIICSHILAYYSITIAITGNAALAWPHLEHVPGHCGSEVVQPLLRCPSLDMLQHLNVSLVVRGPKLNSVFEVWPHQCRVQGHDHFPTPAGHAIFDTSQDAIGFLGHLGTLLAHIQAAVNQHSQVLLCQAAFQPLFPKPVALHGVAVTQVQDPALGLVKPHTIGLSPSIQPVQIPLQSLPILKQINTPTELGVISKLTEGALDPLVQIIDKDIKQNRPQY